ncbi:MAG: DUF4960 domain-containing protein, partial [Bacteroidota bacterium]
MKQLLSFGLLLFVVLLYTGCGDDDEMPMDQPTNITIFRITSPFDAVGVVDETTKSITVDYPFGADISAVTGSITLPDGATASPDLSSPVDFSGGPVTITVTNGPSTTTYTVIFVEGENPLRIALVGDAATMDGLDAEIKTAYQWAIDEYGTMASYIPFSDLTAEAVSTAKVIWFHYTVFPRTTDQNDNDMVFFPHLFDADGNGPDHFEAFEILPASAISASGVVESFVKGGGNLLLTGLTGSYVAQIGRIEPQFGPTNYDTGGDEFIDNPDCWGVSFLDGIFNVGDYPANNENAFLYAGVDRTSYTFEGVTYDGICLSTGGAKKNRAHIWDFNRFFPSLAGGCDSPNEKKAMFESETNSIVRSSFEWDPAACGVELGAIVEFPATGDYQGGALVIGLGAYEWEMRDGRARPSTVSAMTKNAIDNYLD